MVLDTILQEVIRKITDIFHFDATRIALFDSQSDELHVRTSYILDEDNDITLPKSYKLGEVITGKVLETGKSIIFEDIEGGGDGELKPL